jgi:cell division protein FtsN
MPPARRETTPVVAAVVVPPAPTPRLTAPDIPARTGRETTATPSSVPKRAAQKAFSVQVGSFRSQEHATRLLSKLIQKGYQAQITTFTGPGGDAWYRVRVGNFADRSAATQTAQQLKTQNQGSTIVAVD